MEVCDECGNYECDNFVGMGWCRLDNAMVLNDDLACERFVELPDDGEQHVVDLMKSSGYLFPETDEQIAAYEANVKLRELPEKFRTPEFVFKAAQTNE